MVSFDRLRPRRGPNPVASNVVLPSFAETMASIERSRTPVIPPESDDRRRWSMEAVQRSNVRDSYSSNSSGFSLFDARVSYASSRTSPFVPGTNRVSPAPSPVGPPPRHEEWQSTTLPPIRGSHREEKLYFPMMLAPTPRRPSSPPPEPMSERAWLDGCTAPAPAPARGVEPGPCRSGSNRRHAGAGRVGPYSLDGPHLVSPHHPPSPTAATRPRRRGNLPREVTERLRHWFSTHLAHPYPTEDEKQQLMADTRLTLCQISNWFINARRRQLPIAQMEAEAEARLRAQVAQSHPSPPDEVHLPYRSR